MKTIISVITIFFSIFSYGAQDAWSDLSLHEKAEILYDLDYFSPEGDLVDLQVKNLLTDGEWSAENIENKEYRDAAEKVLKIFGQEVSRESIEQSPYSTYGDEEISGFYFLLSKSGEILGGSISFFQDGRDQEGEDSDVNWSATMRFDAEGKPFVDESGLPFDEMRFEWSGH